jgi:hypothetical protein
MDQKDEGKGALGRVAPLLSLVLRALPVPFPCVSLFY